MNNKTAPRP